MSSPLCDSPPATGAGGILKLTSVDPVLFESLVRRFQSATEREVDGKAKGYSRILEADLLRGEAKLDKLRGSAPGKPAQPSDKTETSPITAAPSAWLDTEAELPPPKSREEGRERWHRYLADRFIHGRDEDFDYSLVDGNEDYDTQARRERTDAWIEDEEPSWAGPDGEPVGGPPTGPLEGETGIQDYWSSKKESFAGKDLADQHRMSRLSASATATDRP